MKAQEASVLAFQTMSEWGLVEEGWTFRWSSALVQYGSCCWSKKQIALSLPLVELNDEDSVTETIRHEVAHALAGRDAGHGPEWVAWARKVGSTGVRCYDSRATKTPVKRWRLVCPACLRTMTTRQELSKKMRAKKLMHRECFPDGRWLAGEIGYWEENR